MDERRVYVPLQNKQIVALDRQTGAPVWMHEADVRWPPLTRSGVVLLVTSSDVQALDAATGKSRWRRVLERAPAAALGASNVAILVVSDAGDVTALRHEDGGRLWQTPLGAAPASAPVSDGELAFVSLTDGRVVALDAADGRSLWEQRLSGTLTEPVVATDRVFVGSSDNYFYALDAKTGALRWKWRAGGDVAGIAATEDVVFFVSLDNLIRAVNRSNGNQRWRKNTQGRPSGSLAMFGGAVVVADLTPAISALDELTGATMSSVAAPGDLEGGALVDAAGTSEGVTVAFITLDGRASGYRQSTAPPPAPAVPAGTPPAAPGAESVGPGVSAPRP
jgi:outer membrane protein assembly factor BamB